MATKNSVGDCYNTLPPNEQRKLAVKYLKPLAQNKKILAYLDGNHEGRVGKETDELPGEVICELMGCPSVYDPDAAILFLSVGYNRSEGKKVRNVYSIYMHHGAAGGQTIGGKANALERAQRVASCDVFLGAHTHQPLAFPKTIIAPNNAKKSCAYRKQLFVNAGAFMTYARYAKSRAYSPAILGTPSIELSGTHRDFHARV